MRSSQYSLNTFPFGCEKEPVFVLCTKHVNVFDVQVTVHRETFL